MMWNIIVYIVLILIIFILSFFLYKANVGITNQRIWPVPKILPVKKIMLFMGDANLNTKKDPEFIVSKTLNPKLSIFNNSKERDEFKQEAINYFKLQFGLSNTFINTFIFELVVNTKMGYHCRGCGDKPLDIIDGGYVVPIPAGIKLYGRYGGNNGISSPRASYLAYGLYKMKDYIIKYIAPCPLQSLNTYDASYNFIDCDVIIIKAPDKSLIGLNGKAQGILKKIQLSDGRHYIGVRNILRF